MALTDVMYLRSISSLPLALGVLACASASVRPDPEVQAVLSRGGGLNGIAQTIRISSTSGEPEATSQFSNESRARTIRLPRKTLDSSLVVIESLVGKPPPVPPDTGILRRVCAHVISSRNQIRRCKRGLSHPSECPNHNS